MASRDVLVVGGDGRPTYRVRLRPCTATDIDVLEGVWEPVLERGPRQWLDREWVWDGLDATNQLAFDVNPEWLVLADEVEDGARRDLLGVLVTTGPVTPSRASLDVGTVGEGGILWVEYVAIAPSMRPDCPPADRGGTRLKGIGAVLMHEAIKRSKELGCDGRVGLHAEGDGARTKYTEWEMLELPEAPHPAGGSYPIFFGSAGWAQKFAERRRVPR